MKNTNPWSNLPTSNPLTNPEAARQIQERAERVRHGSNPEHREYEERVRREVIVPEFQRQNGGR